MPPKPRTNKQSQDVSVVHVKNIEPTRKAILLPSGESKTKLPSRVRISSRSNPKLPVSSTSSELLGSGNPKHGSTEESQGFEQESSIRFEETQQIPLASSRQSHLNNAQALRSVTIKKDDKTCGKTEKKPSSRTVSSGSNSHVLSSFSGAPATAHSQPTQPSVSTAMKFSGVVKPSSDVNTKRTIRAKTVVSNTKTATAPKVSNSRSAPTTPVASQQTQGRGSGSGSSDPFKTPTKTPGVTPGSGVKSGGGTIKSFSRSGSGSGVSSAVSERLASSAEKHVRRLSRELKHASEEELAADRAVEEAVVEADRMQDVYGKVQNNAVRTAIQKLVTVKAGVAPYQKACAKVLSLPLTAWEVLPAPYDIQLRDLLTSAADIDCMAQIPVSVEALTAASYKALSRAQKDSDTANKAVMVAEKKRKDVGKTTKTGK